MADHDYLRSLAARLGLPADATTNEDLERALASRLKFDQWTDDWSDEWLANLTGRAGPEPVRVVQEPARRDANGPALGRRPRPKERRR
jgi:hypothetical protein